ncbi:hypothetical protein ACFL39_00300 [Gemmatimonadota bacterium]
MRSKAPYLLSVLMFLSLTTSADAQQAVRLSGDSYTLHSGQYQAHLGPLALSASTGRTSIDFISLRPGIMRGTAPAAMQYGWRRTDREIGRAWVGSMIGFFFAWVADLAIHQEYNFSKANWLWNEGTDNKVQNGEVVFNILLYNGLTPLYAKNSITRVSPVKTNGLPTYLSGLVGSLLGMWYWTDLDKRNPNDNNLYDIRGFAAYTGLTTLFTFVGHRIFK